MAFESDFIVYLLGASAVTALVGQRVYPSERPQASVTPSVTVTRISGGPEYADDGDAGIRQARLQVDCWAETYAAAKAVADAVITRLSGVQDAVQGSTTFLYITLDAERDAQEGGSGQAEYLHRASLDFIIWTTFSA